MCAWCPNGYFGAPGKKQSNNDNNGRHTALALSRLAHLQKWLFPNGIANVVHGKMRRTAKHGPGQKSEINCMCRVLSILVWVLLVFIYFVYNVHFGTVFSVSRYVSIKKERRAHQHIRRQNLFEWEVNCSVFCVQHLHQSIAHASANSIANKFFRLPQNTCNSFSSALSTCI